MEERTAEGIADGLRGTPHTGSVLVSVAPLGVRDELAASAAAEPAPPDVWLVPVHLTGRYAIVGPLRAPGAAASPCPRCLARRWQLVRPNHLRDGIELGHGTTPVGEPPQITPFAVTAIGKTAAHHIATAPESTLDTPPWAPYIYQTDLQTLAVRRFRLIADSECPACGTRAADTATAAQLDLAPAPKPTPDTYRARRPEDYPLPVDALINDACGALGRGLYYEVDLASTSAVSGCFTTRSEVVDLYEIFWGGHTNRFEESLRVGLLEGLERYAGMQPRAKTIATVSSLADLDAPALDPRACGVYSDQFYQVDRRATPFTPDRPIPWVWGYSLRDRRPVLVPEVLTYYHSTEPAQRFVQECSNGCASGSSLTEAVYYGLLELIERDAFLLSWYGQARLPEIDPATIGRPASRQLVDRLAMYGYRARFFDARIDLPVPVVVAVAQRLDDDLGALCFGAGASLDPEEALASSLTEIATDSLRSRLRTRWDVDVLRAKAADFRHVVALHDHPMIYGLPEMARHAAFLLDRGRVADAGADAGRRGLQALAQSASRLDPPRSTNLGDDLAYCVDALVAQGFDVIAVDQTSPEQGRLGLRTASVIVPGLIPIDFGWSRQRARHMPRMRTALYSAGLVDHELEPADLNPAPHPFP